MRHFSPFRGAHARVFTATDKRIAAICAKNCRSHAFPAHPGKPMLGRRIAMCHKAARTVNRSLLYGVSDGFMGKMPLMIRQKGLKNMLDLTSVMALRKTW
jgi:hypothetical protein